MRTFIAKRSLCSKIKNIQKKTGNCSFTNSEIKPDPEPQPQQSEEEIDESADEENKN